MAKKPLNDVAYPLTVLKALNVEFDGENTVLTTGGQIIYDFGKESASGITEFTVGAFEGKVTLNVSYSDRKQVLDFEVGRLRGDNEIGSCNYLGKDVILPVLPANPTRFERYDIVRTGKYINPLIEGQFRYMCITLIGEGRVVLSEIKNYNTSRNAVPTGAFSCDDENLTKLFEIGARTLDIATIKCNQADYFDGKLLVRGLTYGKNALIYNKKLENNTDLKINFHLCRTHYDLKTIELALFTDKGRLASVKLSDFDYERLNEITLTYKDRRLISEGKVLLETDSDEPDLKFGFLVELGAAFVLEDFHRDGIKEDLSRCFEYFKTDYFISDGGKRDRLPWSGDLEWASKSLYYTFDSDSMRSTLDIMLRFQNEEGYLLACCYPEDSDKKLIEKDKYGLYQSDTFSMWFIVVAYRYFQYTGDKEYILSEFDVLKKALDYALKYIGDNGLFYQRAETSKGTWDNGLGNGSTNTYANILLAVSCKYFSEICLELNKEGADIYFEKYNLLKSNIEERLFSEEEGLYFKCLESKELDNEASSLALMFGFTCAERAKTISRNYKKTVFIYGKILSLLIEGLYNYGLEEEAFGILTGRNEFCTSRGYSSFIDWYDLPLRDDCPHTTSECMLPPRIENDEINCWGDLSHPDTVINHILSGCILGIKPSGFGFKKCIFNPHLYGVGNAKGIIPTPYGKIFVSIFNGEAEIVCPKQIEIINNSNLAKLNVKKVD